jgi:hypothetical protein
MRSLEFYAIVIMPLLAVLVAAIVCRKDLHRRDLHK